MDENQLRLLFQLIRKPIRWDPVPPWVKLDRERLTKFNEVQVQLNTKIAELEAKKINELSEIAGISIK